MSDTKTVQVRIRVNDSDGKLMERLAEDASLQTIDIASILIRAACRALADNGERLPIPLRFHIIDPKEDRETAPKGSNRVSYMNEGRK